MNRHENDLRPVLGRLAVVRRVTIFTVCLAKWGNDVCCEYEDKLRFLELRDDDLTPEIIASNTTTTRHEGVLE